MIKSGLLAFVRRESEGGGVRADGRRKDAASQNGRGWRE